MKLSKEDVQKIAHLARIDIADAEAETLAPQLSAILEYVETLNEVNTDNVEETSQVTGLENVFRADEVEAVDPQMRETLLDAAPERSGDFFKVKSVFN